MEIKTTAIIGAGAIGAYFVRGFMDAGDVDVCLIAEGERKERLSAKGLIIDGKTYFPAVKTPEEAGCPDLLLIATKYDALKGILSDVKKMTGPNTTVLSLLNGIDSEEILEKVIPSEQILYSLMRISAARNGNRIDIDNASAQGVYYGVRGSKEKSERVLAFEALLGKTALKGVFCEDIISEQWNKYAGNIAYNLPQAVFGTGYASYFDSEHMALIRDRILDEVTAVAAAYGITILPMGIGRDSRLAWARFSTLQDLDAGRHTEVDMFLAVLMEKAKAVGISVPFCEYTLHAIHILEEKNDGLFHYPVRG